MTNESLSQLAAILKSIRVKSFKVISTKEVNTYLERGYILWGSPFVYASNSMQAVVAIESNLLRQISSRPQREYARLLAEGLSDQEIAKKMSKSEHTLRHYVTALKSRFNIEDKGKLREFILANI